MQIYRQKKEAIMVLDDGTYSARVYDTEAEADKRCEELVLEMFQFLSDSVPTNETERMN